MVTGIDGCGCTHSLVGIGDCCCEESTDVATTSSCCEPCAGDGTGGSIIINGQLQVFGGVGAPVGMQSGQNHLIWAVYQQLNALGATVASWWWNPTTQVWILGGSTFVTPQVFTGNGAPVGLQSGQDPSMAAIYYDRISGIVYQWDPITSAWPPAPSDI